MEASGISLKTDISVEKECVVNGGCGDKLEVVPTRDEPGGQSNGHANGTSATTNTDDANEGIGGSSCENDTPDKCEGESQRGCCRFIVNPSLSKRKDPISHENSDTEHREQTISLHDEGYLENKEKGREFFIDKTRSHADQFGDSEVVEGISKSDDKEGPQMKSQEYRLNKSDSSVSDLSELGGASDVEDELDEILKKDAQHSQPSCHGELSIKDLPPIEDLFITVPKEECMKVGVVSSIVYELVVVQALQNTPALNIGTVLFINYGEETLGVIFDVLGQVKEPYYVVRFNSEEHARRRGVTEKMDVFCAPKTEHTAFVFVSEIRKVKGSDASWEHNNEPPVVCLDYSDDEQEKMARKRQKGKKAVNKESKRTSPASSVTESDGSFTPDCLPPASKKPVVQSEGSRQFCGRACTRRKALLPYPIAREASNSRPVSYTSHNSDSFSQSPNISSFIPSRPPPTTTPFMPSRPSAAQPSPELLPTPFRITVPPPNHSTNIRFGSRYTCPLTDQEIPYPFNQPVQSQMNRPRTHPPGHPPVQFTQTSNFATIQRALGHSRLVEFGSLPYFMPNQRPGLLPIPHNNPLMPTPGPNVRPAAAHGVSSTGPGMEAIRPTYRVFPGSGSRFQNQSSALPQGFSDNGGSENHYESGTGANPNQFTHFELRRSLLGMSPPGVNDEHFQP